MSDPKKEAESEHAHLWFRWRPVLGAVFVLLLLVATVAVLELVIKISNERFEDSVSRRFQGREPDPYADVWRQAGRISRFALPCLLGGQMLLVGMWAAWAPQRWPVRVGFAVGCWLLLASMTGLFPAWYGPFPTIESLGSSLVTWAVLAWLRLAYGCRLTDRATISSGEPAAAVGAIGFAWGTCLAVGVAAALLSFSSFVGGELGLITRSYVPAATVGFVQVAMGSIVLTRKRRPFTFTVVLPLALVGLLMWWASIAKYLWGWGVSHAPYWPIFRELLPIGLGTTLVVVLAAYLLRAFGYRLVSASSSNLSKAGKLVDNRLGRAS